MRKGLGYGYRTVSALTTDYRDASAGNATSSSLGRQFKDVLGRSCHTELIAFRVTRGTRTNKQSMVRGSCASGLRRDMQFS
jgi:hypothetical protein